ncbi:DNA-dependent ATPase protein rad54, partial [Tulasnella sp. 427]
MLRRVPTKDGRPLSFDSINFDATIFKPFKTPTPLVPKRDTALPPRKRKRVSYKENTDGGDGDDSDDGDKRKKKKAKKGPDGEEWGSDGEVTAVKKYPVYKPTPLESTTKRFSIPVMTNSKGEIVQTVMSRASLGIRPPIKVIPRPLHDPMADHAIVLYDPTIDDRETDEERKEREEAERKEKEKKEAAAGIVGMFNPHKSLKDLLGEDDGKKKKEEKVPVVIDPRLSKVLRPHQIEGVKFLYKCTTGMIVPKQYGCIMADEMGLGKTLQCIALMWTLLKQSPRPGKGTIEKCIIVCPSSLVRNWANEFVKWLGQGTVAALAIDGKGTKQELIEKVRRWVQAKGRNVTQPVMVVSYETLRTLTNELAN